MYMQLKTFFAEIVLIHYRSYTLVVKHNALTEKCRINFNLHLYLRISIYFYNFLPLLLNTPMNIKLKPIHEFYTISLKINIKSITFFNYTL